MEFDIKVAGARELAVHYDRAPALVASTAFRVIRGASQRLADYVVRYKLTGDPLNSRTRNLARAVFHRVELHGRDVVGRVGYDLKKAVYGRAHELGATITPKRAKNLTIPVGEALTPSGVARIGAREFIQKTGKGGGGWRGFTHSFVNKNKTAILGVTKSGDVEAVFLLRKSVRLESRPALREALQENAPDIRRQLAGEIIGPLRAPNAQRAS
jgi:hypothetical protein